MHVSHHVVRFSDTDAAGILYFGSFATYFDESFLSALRSQGIGWDEHKKYNFLLPIVEHKTRFFHPLKFGDEVSVYCWISRIGKTSFTSKHVMIHKETAKICATGYITRVVVDYSQFVKSEIPSELLKILNHFSELPENLPDAVKSAFIDEV
ncbi:MAG: acyl-CoA thioesterase [Methanobacteriota archaeon]|nr:MAG: acyl-CoA thioesterase [Euryarchaeota archaeon]